MAGWRGRGGSCGMAALLAVAATLAPLRARAQAQGEADGPAPVSAPPSEPPSAPPPEAAPPQAPEPASPQAPAAIDAAPRPTLPLPEGLDNEDAPDALRAAWMSRESHPHSIASLRVLQQGRALPIGFFGGGVDRPFGDVPEALAAGRRFRALRIAGVVLHATGVAVFIASEVFQVSLRRSMTNEEFTAAMAMDGVAIAMEAAGLGCLFGAPRPLGLAVERHNDAMLRRYLPLRVSPIALPGGGGVALGLRM